MDVLVDNSTIEIFINDGEYVFSNIIFPQLSSNGLRLWTDSHVYLEYFKIKKATQQFIF